LKTPERGPKVMSTYRRARSELEHATAERWGTDLDEDAAAVTEQDRDIERGSKLNPSLAIQRVVNYPSKTSLAIERVVNYPSKNFRIPNLPIIEGK